MPRFQLKYLSQAGAIETVQADCAEDAEDMARLRLLFSEPGFAIAVISDGQELRRVVQRPKPSALHI